MGTSLLIYVTFRLKKRMIRTRGGLKAEKISNSRNEVDLRTKAREKNIGSRVLNGGGAA